MANTEGLTDEAVETLLGDNNNYISNCIVGSRPSSLQQRMDLPMGDRPAARVTRFSKNRPVVASSSTKNAMGETAAAPSSSSKPPSSFEPVIGEIVERRTKRTARKQKQSGTTASQKGPSRFALKKQVPNGFPSLNAPMGSLRISKTASPKTTKSETMETDADRMLAQMSSNEIEESVQELTDALSPETLKFLKQRGHAKTKKEMSKIGAPVVTSSVTSAGAHDEDDTAEKERVAKVLSSIRTYEDMDAAVRQEMETTSEEECNLEPKNDLQTATELLRSSVPRQNLWAIRFLRDRFATELKTETRYCLGTPTADEWPYDVVLPVSLRCLLDTSSATAVGVQIRTDALETLHLLLCLRVPLDYVLYDTARDEMKNTPAHLYQEYVMDDAVPTSSYQYATNSLQPLSVSNSPVAYAANSSSTSAKEDGDAFVRDPLWTLLSKMKIVPWLASWLTSSASTLDSFRTAVGILILLVQRSPGAATAVVQHPVLLKLISSQCSYSSLLLRTVAARQSRLTAHAMAPSETTIANLISLSNAKDFSADDLRYHKQTMVLWRTYLRYGLALQATSSILSLAARPITLGSELSCEFFSAFAVLLNCLRASSNFDNESQQDKEAHVTTDDRSILSQLPTLLSASRRQALLHLDSIEDAWLSDLNTDDPSFCRRLKFYASLFRFLSSWMRVCNGLRGEHGNGDFKVEDFSEEGRCISAILLCLKQKELLKFLRLALSDLHNARLSPLNTSNSGYLQEVAACTFVEAMLDFINSTYCDEHLSTDHATAEGLRRIRDLLTEEFVLDISRRTISVYRSEREHASRLLWVNRTHAAILKLLATSQVVSELSVIARSRLGACLLSVIGRLNVGDESTAAILFSCDRLLKSTSESDMDSASNISSWFVRRLCSTADDRTQLDHSFKLRGGLGISQDMLGPFDLISLLCSVNTGARENLLPLGPFWLWKSLAGTATPEANVDETIGIIQSTLGLCWGLESTNAFLQTCYTNDFYRGGKVYFLMNLALKPEAVLADEKIEALACLVFDASSEGCSSLYIRGFVEECWLHDAKASAQRKPAKADTSSTDRETDYMALFHLDESTDEISSDCMHALLSFSSDLCDSFLEYGAQFLFCSKCILHLLASGFPSKVRSQVIQRLGGALHLLSVVGEEELKRCLLKCVAVGVPGVDGAFRDTPDILDEASSILSCEASVRTDATFAINWAVAHLARDLIGCCWIGSSLHASKSRVSKLPHRYGAMILAIVESVSMTQGSAEDLVQSTLLVTTKIGTFVETGSIHGKMEVLVNTLRHRASQPHSN